MNEWDRDKLKIELNEVINEILGNKIKCTEKEKIPITKHLTIVESHALLKSKVQEVFKNGIVWASQTSEVIPSPRTCHEKKYHGVPLFDYSKASHNLWVIAKFYIIFLNIYLVLLLKTEDRCCYLKTVDHDFDDRYWGYEFHLGTRRHRYTGWHMKRGMINLYSTFWQGCM